jgi:hypothetical protein
VSAGSFSAGDYFPGAVAPEEAIASSTVAMNTDVVAGPRTFLQSFLGGYIKERSAPAAPPSADLNKADTHLSPSLEHHLTDSF